MDKMYDNQDYDGMSVDDRMKMAESCGLALRKLIHTYTGLDTHKIEGVSLGLPLTAAAMPSWGMHDVQTYQITRMNERATHFKQPLQPQLGMSRCYGLPFFKI